MILSIAARRPRSPTIAMNFIYGLLCAAILFIVACISLSKRTPDRSTSPSSDPGWFEAAKAIASRAVLMKAACSLVLEKSTNSIFFPLWLMNPASDMLPRALMVSLNVSSKVNQPNMSNSFFVGLIIKKRYETLSMN